jgi:hypothetical protein
MRQIALAAAAGLVATTDPFALALAAASASREPSERAVEGG